MKFRIFGFLAAGILSAGVVQSQTAPWISKEEADPITDSIKYSAATIGENGELLAAACYEGRVHVAVRLSNFDFSIREVRKVAYRVDKNNPVTMEWINARNSVFGIIDDLAASFIKEIAAGNKVVIRSGSNTVEFSMNNAKEALLPLFENCPVLKDA